MPTQPSEVFASETTPVSTGKDGAPHRRVLLVSTTVMHYRVSVYNYIHRRFRENGWEWRVLTNQLQPRNAVAPRFPIEIIPFNFFRYRRRIRELRPDAVILFLHHKERLVWPLAHWLKLAGIPFASWTKGGNMDRPSSIPRKALFGYFNRLSDALIVYSEKLRKNLGRSFQKKTFVANNTINHEDFPGTQEEKGEIKRSLSIPFGKVVLFVGRMDVDNGRKRVDHLIEIFRDVEGRDAGLVIVGSGMQPQWKERINPATTLYLGEIHDPRNLQIARIFKMADLCAIPGHVGLGLNQAFLFGLPVITMHGNQPPEIDYLHDGQNGYIVPENDVGQLRRRIFELLDDDSRRSRFSEAARATFFQEASVEGMFRGFQECASYLFSQTVVPSTQQP